MRRASHAPGSRADAAVAYALPVAPAAPPAFAAAAAPLVAAAEPGAVSAKTPPAPAAVPALVTLATRRAARDARVGDLLQVAEFFPPAVRAELFANLEPPRLRLLELVWRDAAGESEGQGWPFESESQRAWRGLWEAGSLNAGTTRAHARQGSADAFSQPRDFRQLFWERYVRTMLKSRTNEIDANNSSALDQDIISTSDLFADVVQTLCMHGREVRSFNVPLIAALRRLRRLEIHHPEQQRTCWNSLLQLLTSIPGLRELGFFHGKLKDIQLAQVREQLCGNATDVIGIELVSVKLRPADFRELVKLVSEFQGLEQLRVTSSISDLETFQLVNAALLAPNLKVLALEHNDLNDDPFMGLAKTRRAITLRHLRLSNNALQAGTLGAISDATSSGYLTLESLELANNTDVRDAGVVALTPMLANSISWTGLRKLDLRNCEFGLEAATNLLLALRDNRSLTHLNLSQNFLGSSFGDILADFLLANKTIRILCADYIGLTDGGCTKRLCRALRQNHTLDSVSLAANRLRDSGASTLFRPIVERGRIKPFTRVDLSGNLLTCNALDEFKDIVGMSPEIDSGDENEGQANQHKRRRLDHGGNDTVPGRPEAHLADRIGSCVICELSLLNNDFKGDTAGVLGKLRQHVTHLISNEWTGRRSVYDDEV